MLEGVPNLVANQEPARYGPSYRAADDQFGQCDTGVLRLNEAVLAGFLWNLANDSTRLPRHTHADIQALNRSPGPRRSDEDLQPVGRVGCRNARTTLGR